MKQASLLTKSENRAKKRTPLWLPLIVVLSVLTLLLIYILASTFIRANQLMKADTHPLTPFGSNILKSYEYATFTTPDGQLLLNGWLLDSAQEQTKATIIIAHDQSMNRLPYDLESAALFNNLTQNGFAVLTFDQRHVGESEGEISSFGYAESEDIVGALSYVQRLSPQRPIILYGFGSGTTAILRAFAYLEQNYDIEKAHAAKQADEQYLPNPNLIAGLILDTPVRSSDNLIAIPMAHTKGLGKYYYPHTVPYAVRLSAGNKDKIDFLNVITKLPLPVLLLGREHDSILPRQSYVPFWEERLRLYQKLTHTYQAPGSGHLDAYLTNQNEYLEAIELYLNNWFK